MTSVLYTGGTFGMRQTVQGLTANPHLGDEVAALVSASQSQGQPASAWTYSEVAQAIDSAEATPETLAQLADQIRSLALRDNSRAVLVIHGTDTMAYTAAFVAFATADLTVPVIFTGAQLPLGSEGSDAPGNFAFAFEQAAAGLPAGTWIAFGGRILPAVRAQKVSANRFEAFAAERPLASEAAGLDQATSDALAAAAGARATRIGLVKVSPGLTAGQLAATLDVCPDGVVLECYGSGTAPVIAAGLAEVIRPATQRGTPVLAVTQCRDGSINIGRYAVGSALAEAGVADGGDLTVEAALGKLGALTRAGITGAELQRLLGSNLLGERVA